MINIGQYIETAINWLTEHFASFFDALSMGIGGFIDGFQHVLFGIPFYITIAVLAALAWFKSGKGTAVFTLLGLLLIYGMGFWEETMQTLALVLSSTCLALLLGVPLGIWTANSDRCNKIMRPVLDFMQTMPAFVYLIPAVLFFGLGTVPGAFATIIFAMPPVVRLTGLGIRQVPKNVVEASRSFGATPWQLLYKVQLPLALPTILTGINQTIMMSLSMVVIAAMISAGGLGEIVLKGITQMKIGLGFEGGIAVVILAIVLDRITQGMADNRKMIAAMFIAGILLTFVSCGDNGKSKKISIAYANWSEGIAMTNLAKAIFEDQGYDVKLLNADLAPIFTSISRKKADVFMDVWMPVTMEDYMKQYGDKLEVIGDIYDGARIGLVIPDYVTINSIEELNAEKERFSGQIVGIDAGAGIMKATDQAIKDYGLDYKLMTSSGPAMTASLKKAIDKKDWIVVTGWTPHWMFDRFKLKVLQDPKLIYGNTESIHTIAWKGFSEKDPFAAELLGNIRLTDAEISSLMTALEEAQTTERQAARQWMEEHQELVNSWIPEKD